MPLLTLLKLITIAKEAIPLAHQSYKIFAETKSKLEQVHAEGRELTPAEFDEIVARLDAHIEEFERAAKD